MKQRIVGFGGEGVIARQGSVIGNMEQCNGGTREFDIIGDGERRNDIAQLGQVRTPYQPVGSLVSVDLRRQLAFVRVRNVRCNLQGRLGIAGVDGEVDVELAAIVPMLPARNGIEHGIAVAQAHGLDRHRIPGYIAEPAHGGERVANLVPVVSHCYISGYADARQAGGVLRDGAAVLHAEGDGCCGRNLFRQGNDGFRQATSVVNV